MVCLANSSDFRHVSPPASRFNSASASSARICCSWGNPSTYVFSSHKHEPPSVVGGLGELPFYSFVRRRWTLARFFQGEVSRDRIVRASHERIAPSKPLPRVGINHLSQLGPVPFGFAPSLRSRDILDRLFDRVSTVATDDATNIMFDRWADQIILRPVDEQFRNAATLLRIVQFSRLPSGSQR